MTTATSELLPPGYWVDPATGAWCSLPWPTDPDEKMALVRSSLGPGVIDWSEGRTDEPGLWHYMHRTPWRWTDGQKRFIVLWYALDDAGRFVYRSGIKRGAKGPIAHDTLVPTPTGWLRHGDLIPGTQVIGGDGLPCKVAAVHPEVFEDCYRVTFSDGESVVATHGHRWPMEFLTPRARYEMCTVTTAEMAANLTRKDGARLWRQQMPAAVKLPEVDLPLDPYALGAWLGDGWKSGAEMAGIDAEVWESFEALGYPIRHKKNGRNWRVGGLAKNLRSAGVFGDKHIPATYLRASIDQRIALLQGLMDSDGSCDTRGVAEFCNTNKRIVDGFSELLASLGIKHGVKESRATLNDVDYGPRWRVGFTTYRDTTPLFRIRRKLERQRLSGGTAHRGMSLTRQVISVDRVPTVPARCITVDSGDHTYRVGARMVQTCNTGKDPMLAALCNTELLGPVEPADRDDATGLWVGRARGFPLVQVMSNSEDQSKKVLRIANGMWTQDARDHYELDCGETRTIIKGTGARFEVPTAAEASSEGDPVTFAGINESHHMTPSNGGDENAAVIRRNVAKSPADVQARAIEFTNAHRQGMGSVAEESYLAWQAQQSPAYRSKRDILYDTIEAPPGTNILTHEGRIAGLAAAYLDAGWNDKERISDEMADRRTSVADSIRFYLNGLGAEEDSWVEPPNFDALAAAETIVADRERVALFVDCSKSGDATAATLTRLSDLFTWELGCWEKPPGWTTKRNGPWRAPRTEVDAAVRGAWDEFDVVWMGVDPSPAKDDEDDALYWQATIDGWRRDFGHRLKIWATPGANGDPVRFDMRLSQAGGVRRNQQFTEAAEWLALEVDGDDGNGHTGTTWRHGGSSKLRIHTHNARRRPNQWGVSLGKVTRDSDKHIDTAVCMVGSVMGARLALNSGKLPDEQDTSVFVFR